MSSIVQGKQNKTKLRIAPSGSFGNLYEAQLLVRKTASMKNMSSFLVGSIV